ncbi:hypothetical protein HAX54_051718, partial [Datura stramonium]|nr:hypothetical protein [Datura stramonium]
MFCDFTEFGTNFTNRHPPKNHRSGPAKCRMKRRLGFKASGHYPRPMSHQCSTSQNQRSVGVSPDDPYVPSIMLMSVANRLFTSLHRHFVGVPL